MSEKHISWLERLSSIVSREPQDKEQLIDLLRDAEERDILSADMLSMIERVVQVSDMQVREVMVPKSTMIVVEKQSTLPTLLPLVIESGHSRFPVIDSSTNEVLGILLAKDLLKYSSNNADTFNVASILRPAIFVPESKRLNILLHEFRINRNHIAIVLDEYGQVSGLVTIEDVLEQIVGNIEDEYDIDEQDDIKKHENGVFTVKASTPIDLFNHYFQTTFSDAEFDTIGGLVLKSSGRLPTRGDVIKMDQYRFKILHSDNRRIHLLEVKKVKSLSTLSGLKRKSG